MPVEQKLRRISRPDLVDYDLVVIRREQLGALMLSALHADGSSEEMTFRDDGSEDAILCELVGRTLVDVGNKGAECLGCRRRLGGNADPSTVAEQVAAIAVCLPSIRPQQPTAVQTLSGVLCQPCRDMTDDDNEKLRAKVTEAFREHAGMTEVGVGTA
jgi:hypothetical protein